MARILIADDDPDFRRAMASAVEALGHEAVLAADGDAAIACHLDRPADLVLLDMLMPGRGGVSTLSEFAWRFPGLPVVVMTGNDLLFEAPICRSGLRCAEAVVAKRFSLDTLGRLLDRSTSRATCGPRPA